MALGTPTALGTASSSTTVSSASITTSAAINTGDTVYVLISCGATPPSGISVTDSGSNTYTARYALDASGVAVYRTVATAGVALGGTITITLTGGTSAVAICAHKMGVSLTSGAADQVYTIASSTTHAHAITEQGGVYMLAFDVTFGSVTSSTVSNYTEINKVTGSGSRNMEVAYNEPVSNGSTTYQVVWNASHSGQIVALTEVQAASSAHLLALTGAGS